MMKLNLKSETSLFEWTWSDYLYEINIIIQKLINNEPIHIQRIDNNDYMEGTTIKTSHYLNRDYNEIVIRRSKRFLDDIKNNKEILFIRDDLKGTINLQEIQTFYSLIHTINPQLSFKFLLLSERDRYNEIQYPNLHHKIYDIDMYKSYIDSCYNTFENFNTILGDISEDEY